MLHGFPRLDRACDDMIDAVAEQRKEDFFAPLFSHFVPRLKAYLMRGGAGSIQADDIAHNQRLNAVRRGRRLGPDPQDPSFAPHH